MSLNVARHDLPTPGLEPIKDIHPFDALAAQLKDAKKLEARLCNEWQAAIDERKRIEELLLDYYNRATA